MAYFSPSPDDRRSTSSFRVVLGLCLIS